jgi:phosphotransferase system enzyme I (PtsP)
VIRGLPAQARDDVDVSLLINGGLLIDLDHLEDTGADGVGLLRTEIAFMLHPNFPSLAGQREIYGGIFEAAGDKPAVFRTFDIGGDKLLLYFSVGEDENRAMGSLWTALGCCAGNCAL